MKKTICVILILVLTASLIPIFAIAPYNHPVTDDLIYGAETRAVVQEGASFKEIIKTAAESTRTYYHTWQGTYSAIFMMCLQPGIFGDTYYAVTPFVMVFSLIAATLFFFGVIMRRYWKFDLRSYLIVTMLVLELSIQMLPSAAEGFYWFNGAIFYTFFYALGLCMIALLLLVFTAKKRAGKIICSGLAVLLALIIGGGNYATLLGCWIVLAFMTGWQIFKKRIMNASVAGAVFAVLTVFGAFSVFSEGSAARHLIFRSPNLITAFLVCFAAGAASLIKNINPTTVLLIVMTAGLAIPCVKKTELKFRRPWLVLLIGFCIYCAQFMPTAFVAGSIGPYRMRNIIYFSYYILVVVSTVWFTGNAVRKFENNETAIKLWNYMRSKTRTVFVVLAMAVLTAASAIQYGIWGFTTLSAAKDLMSGEAKKYDTFYKLQKGDIQDSDIIDAETEENPYSVRVFMVDTGQGQPDPGVDYIKIP